MTRQQAINEKCKECNNDPEAEGTWKTQTEACDLTDCGLWPYTGLNLVEKLPIGVSVQLYHCNTRLISLS